MFGYVYPCKMELKIKDYEKFKAYYCGLCKSIKRNFGNLPRVFLNYDMTFLAILLNSLDEESNSYSLERCMIHPIEKRRIIKENSALNYAAHCNIILAYYKLLDNYNDDKKIYNSILASFLKKFCGTNMEIFTSMGNELSKLYKLESNCENVTLDELSHPFAHLTGLLMCSYFKMDILFRDDLYHLGYNLGKWIYIIDAYDDLKKDMHNNKFNAVAASLNNTGSSYDEFIYEFKDRIDFLLGTSASFCVEYLMKLPITKNKDLLNNILQLGLMEKMDIVFKRSEKNEKSL